MTGIGGKSLKMKCGPDYLSRSSGFTILMKDSRHVLLEEILLRGC